MYYVYIYIYIFPLGGEDRSPCFKRSWSRWCETSRTLRGRVFYGLSWPEPPILGDVGPCAPLQPQGGWKAREGGRVSFDSKRAHLSHTGPSNLVHECCLGLRGCGTPIPAGAGTGARGSRVASKASDMRVLRGYCSCVVLLVPFILFPGVLAQGRPGLPQQRVGQPKGT